MNGEEEITVVLDGQQRLTSLYIALRGTYSYKLPRKRWDNDSAYPERRLYLNLLAPPEDQALAFDFRFLTKSEAQEKDENNFWFPVGDILELKELDEVSNYLIEQGLTIDFGKEKAKFANHALAKLYKIIHIQPSISYYLEKSQELDKVLNIFIRINNGGTILSYSDLLLSIATAQWKIKDAREEITQFVDELNGMGNGFFFSKDFILKACLVMTDIPNIAFIVDNFKKENMLKIESNWDKMTHSLRIAVGLVSSFGYTSETLLSYNAVIPIAYYLMKIDATDSFIHSSHNRNDRSVIHRWLLLSLVKRVFGGQSDSVLRNLRTLLNQNTGNGFPIDEIINFFKGTNKTLVFTDEDIDAMLATKYGQAYTFSVLSLIYPSLDFKNKFHIDHIWPKCLFTNPKLRSLGVPDSKLDSFKERVNLIGNLQLLEAIPNIEKQDTEFNVWLDKVYPTIEAKKLYKEKHYIPKDVSLDFPDFLQFLEKREALIKTEIKMLLGTEA